MIEFASQQLVSRAIKKLKEENLIQEYENEWFYNPFVFTIAGMSDNEKHEAQKKWEKLFGYYNFYEK